ncbi:MAG TPA: leucyl aminopeptidase [Jiangellaceae bacterium]|nr:leucyl aminopeptidase [Jiangellaceae bacterium]
MPAEKSASAMIAVTPPAVEHDPGGLLDVSASAIAVPVWPGNGEGPRIGARAEELARALAVDAAEALRRENKTGKAGELLALPGTGDIARILLVGVGDGSPAAFRKAGAAVARAARGIARLASAVTAEADDAAMHAFIEAIVLASYGWRVRGQAKAPLGTLVLTKSGPYRAAAVDVAAATAGAVWFARDLVHTPSNIKDPSWLADQARIAAARGDLEVRIWDERALADDGFGGIVAVGMGSERPPRLIELTYSARHAGRNTPHIVLVGKGITFDSGGLSLKPRDSMVAMKTDMSGGAVVIAVLSALRAVGCPLRVTGVVPAAENLPSGSAQRPSDVIRQYDGTTVEVRNTDAEGRLVLADAIGYAVAAKKPDLIVDVATLTGAATVALGRRHAALYSTSDSLADALVTAGAAAGEKLWRMPLVADYREALESDIADLAHVETRKMGGGSITAALFLERFARGVPWAHLDIAGTGRADADSDELVKGGTAFGVRTLLHWLSTGSIEQRQGRGG